jgi:hypothetical protein
MAVVSRKAQLGGYRNPLGYGRNIPFPPVDFTEYVFEEFPKIVMQKADEPYLKAWRERNHYIDERTQRVCYMGGMPRLGTDVAVIATANDVESGFAEAVNDPVTIADAEMQRRWLEEHPETLVESHEYDNRTSTKLRIGSALAEAVRLPTVAAAIPAAQPAQSDAFAAILAEMRSLKAELAEIKNKDSSKKAKNTKQSEAMKARWAAKKAAAEGESSGE